MFFVRFRRVTPGTLPTAMRGHGRACPRKAVGTAPWLAALAWAAGFQPLFSASVSDAALADCRLTVRAREALLQDGVLRELNLGVSVRNNVATLWGPAPSKSLSDRAVGRVRKVPGIADVINRLVVESPADPLVQFLRTAPGKPQAGTNKPPPVPVKAQAALTGRREDPKLIPELAWHPADRGSPPNVSLPAPNLPVTSFPAIPLPAIAVSPGDPAQAVERLRQANDRLRGVRPEWSGRAVRLHGTVLAWQDLYDFAKAVAHVPGVERVVLDGVRLDPNAPR